MPTIGLFSVNSHACADPRIAARLAERAEQLGYDSLWAGEHVVLPSPRVDPSPMDPEEPILDPLIALAHLAAHTQRILLGTGVLLLPQRNPVVLAKQVASLDVLSNGRLMLGIGVAYLEPEMRAIGVPMEGRGTRSDEYLAAMRSLWEDDAPSYHGSYVSFEGVDAHPRPAQTPLPIIVGGRSAAGHRRAARYGEGWYGFMLGRKATAEHIEGLRKACAAESRDRPLHISVTPSRPLDPETAQQYADLGVDRLIVMPPPGLTLGALLEFVEANAPARLGATPRHVEARPGGHVRITAEGTLLAESQRAQVVLETGHAPRYYVPREDVLVPLTGPTAKRTHCPKKGDADHYSTDTLEDIAWSYAEPFPAVAPIAGLISFYPDRVEVECQPSRH
jgi:probable F420-dependent oxidoreductase